MLMPMFILGCSALMHEHQDKIRRFSDTIKRFSNFGIIKPTREVMEKTWRSMDAMDEASWDWETIIRLGNHYA